MTASTTTNPGTRPGVLLTLLLALVCAGPAAADGFIIVHPPRPEVRVVPLWIKKHHVTVDIQGQVAATSVDQVFHNPNGMQLEGTYIFPVPEGAAIDHLSLWIDGVEQKAELLDRDKARSIYEDIVRRMKDPALLEYVGRKAFKLRVFPIPPNGDRRVKLSYREVVPADGGLARYLYPLNTEKFSSRPLESVLLDIKLSSPRPLGNVMALSHKAEITRADDHHARITYEAQDVTPDRDFLLHYSSTTKDVGLDLVAHRPAGENGYALIALSPRQDLEEDSFQPKDVVFVFDTSGSMNGARFRQALAALRFGVNTLRTGDRFSIVTFSTEARRMWDQLREVSDESRKEALAYIDKLEALGGTNIDEALQLAQGLNPAGDRPFMMLFLTDGQPTMGDTTDVDEILSRSRKRSQGSERIFVFGVGNDVNTELLDRLAGENRGARDYVTEKEDIEVKVSNLWSKVANPVLSDVTLTCAGGGATLEDSYPRKVPDLFHGSQLILTSRYTGSGPTAVKLTGKMGGATREYVYECTFPGEEAGNDYLPRLWGVRKVGYLLDQIHSHGESQELKDEVVRLSRKYGIMTPYTSFLVVEDQPVASTRPQAPGRRRLMRELEESDGFGLPGGAGARTPGAPAPQDAIEGAFRAGELRQRYAQGGRGRDAPAAEADEELLGAFEGKDAAKALSLDTGEESVRASRLIARLKDAREAFDRVSSLGGDLTGRIRHVGSRTFYRHGDGWVQAEVYDLGGEPELVRVEAFSDAYFALLTAHPELSGVLAIGEAVCFLLEGRIYLINAS